MWLRVWACGGTLNLHWQQLGYMCSSKKSALWLSLWHLDVGFLELGEAVRTCVVFNGAGFSCIMFSTVMFAAVSFTGVKFCGIVFYCVGFHVQHWVLWMQSQVNTFKNSWMYGSRSRQTMDGCSSQHLSKKVALQGHNFWPLQFLALNLLVSCPCWFNSSLCSFRT